MFSSLLASQYLLISSSSPLLLMERAADVTTFNVQGDRFCMRHLVISHTSFGGCTFKFLLIHNNQEPAKFRAKYEEAQDK